MRNVEKYMPKDVPQVNEPVKVLEGPDAKQKATQIVAESKAKSKKPRNNNKVPIWKRSPSLIVGAIIVAAAFFVAFFPQLIIDESMCLPNFGARTVAPCAEHLFGTDKLGQDIFARVIWATKLDLFIGVGSVALPFVIGTLLGLVSGYYGGKVDTIIMRVLDIFVAFPFMVLAIAIVAILGNGIINLLIAMWIVSWPPYTRLVRAEVLVAKNSEYVMAAKTLGYSDMKIMFRHILPNVVSSSVVYAASDIVMCIMTAASMSFLGLGVPIDVPEWGNIISSGKLFMNTAWWITTMPGAVMAFVGLGFSLFGDGLNDLLRTKD